MGCFEPNPQLMLFGWQITEQTSPFNGVQAEAKAEELQPVPDFNEEFVPGTMCKLALIPRT